MKTPNCRTLRGFHRCAFGFPDLASARSVYDQGVRLKPRVLLRRLRAAANTVLPQTSGLRLASALLPMRSRDDAALVGRHRAPGRLSIAAVVLLAAVTLCF